MHSLGTDLERKGSYRISMDHRGPFVFAVWVKTRSYSCSRRVPLVMRVRKFRETLGRSFLLGSGGWCLTYSEMQRIDKWEKSLLIQMLNRHKSDQENREGNISLAAKLRLLQNRCRIVPLSLHFCMMYFGWAGHVARIPVSSVWLEFWGGETLQAEICAGFGE
jgi:hypothetical protein